MERRPLVLDSTGTTLELPVGDTLAGQTDLQTELNAKEPSLGNPTTTGQVLSSTDAGVRSWVDMAAGGGSAARSFFMAGW